MADDLEKADHYKKKRRMFASISYLLTACSLWVAFVEWSIFYFVTQVADFFTQKPWVGSIFFVIGLMLIILFIFIETLRFNFWINWLFALLIFECIVLGMAPLVVRQVKFNFLIGFAVGVVVLVFFILCGTCFPVDLTLNVVVLFVLSVTCIIGAMFFLMIYIVVNVPYSFGVVSLFICCSIALTFVPFAMPNMPFGILEMPILRNLKI